MLPEGYQVYKQVLTGPEQGQERMLSKIFKLRLANYKWPSQSNVALQAGPVELAVRGLYLNRPNFSTVPLNIPIFIYYFLMRLKQTNTNQGFKDSSSNLPL